MLQKSMPLLSLRLSAAMFLSPMCAISITETIGGLAGLTHCMVASGHSFSMHLLTPCLRWGGSICDKVYAVSKAMCGADLFYQVELPSVFTFDHPLGAVMGRAAYSDFFSFSQGCTVGNNHGIYPSFGRSVFMLSDSKVIGSTTIGDNVIIGANAFVKDETVPSGSLVFGSSPNLIVKTGRADYVREYAEGVFVYD